ncbi:MAG TPA: hypothetical protein VGM88_16405 [Kofleriaceae bacterium]
MLRTLAGLVFIAATAALAVWLWRHDTVVSGTHFGSEMLEARRAKGITSVDCDEAAPVTLTGAAFECRIGADDGSTATVSVTLDREGMYSYVPKPGTATPPTHAAPSHRAPTGGDPWK